MVSIADLITPGSAVDIGGFTSPLEVAIGLAVAYLGFDRFRYRKRIRATGERLHADLALPEHVIEKILQDEVVSPDEKGLLTLYLFTEDGELLDRLKELEPELKKNNWIWGTRCYWLMKVLVRWELDRKLVQMFLLLACAFELMIAWLIVSGRSVPGIETRAFLSTFMVTTAVCYLVPFTGYALSEWMMGDIKKAAAKWQEGMRIAALMSARSAAYPKSAVKPAPSLSANNGKSRKASTPAQKSSAASLGQIGEPPLSNGSVVRKPRGRSAAASPPSADGITED